MTISAPSSIEIHASNAAPFLAPLRTRVTARKVETHDTVTLTIEPPEDYAPWKPGQFNMLYLFGLGEVPISISGDPNIQGELIHTVKAVGPVSRAITDLSVGDTVWLRGPFGSAWPALHTIDDLLIVAGGIGLAPLRPVVFAALSEKTRRRLTVLYGTRTPVDVLFASDLVEWSKRPQSLVQVTVDRMDRDSHWNGSVGVVTNLLHRLNLEPSHTTVMTCGPDIMMRHLVTDLVGMGFTDDHIFVSVERNMKCAVGMCGRCQWGPHFVCRDGPIYSLTDVRQLWTVKEF